MPRQAGVGWVVCAAAGLACLAGGAGSAGAQGREVFVDPDTPAGKEYALPLEAARRNAAGGQTGGSGSSGAAQAPLFGAGISPRRPPASGSPDAAGNRRRDGAEERRFSPSAAAFSGNGSGPSAGLQTALIAFGVLALGGAIGLSFRALRPSAGRR